MKLNPSKMYRKAAKLVEHNTSDVAVFGYSCLAIYAAVYCATRPHNDEPSQLVDRSQFVDRYVELFYPPDELNIVACTKDDAWGDLWGKTKQERSDCRVLALLFMSEIAKGE
jgi:hypothetical protein